MHASRVHVIDSHTEGEPTRVVTAGGPDLGRGPLAERVRIFRETHDRFRSAVCNEPRGSDAMVGALLVPPVNPAAATGVIFFNNVGYLNMCVHGTIGLAATLAHMGRLGAGSHLIETPVGDVTVTLEEGGPGDPSDTRAALNRVTVANVPSFRYRKDVEVALDDSTRVRGDIAWGGNWFFLVDDHAQALDARNIEALTERAWRIRQALERADIRGDPSFGGSEGEIDHIELFGPPSRSDCHSKNFVLCPGKAYDRSPCGTGTSAKLACLHADGKLTPGQTWRQESIIGSSFSGTVKLDGASLIPVVTGEAYITGEATLLLDDRDPFRDGIRFGAAQ